MVIGLRAWLAAALGTSVSGGGAGLISLVQCSLARRLMIRMAWWMPAVLWKLRWRYVDKPRQGLKFSAPKQPWPHHAWSSQRPTKRWGYLPMISVPSLPLGLKYRSRQDFEPLGATYRYIPPPSNSLQAPKTPPAIGDFVGSRRRVVETKNRPEGRFRGFPKHSAECSGAGYGAETGVESGTFRPVK